MINNTVTENPTENSVKFKRIKALINRNNQGLVHMIVRAFTSASLILSLCAVCYIAGVISGANKSSYWRNAFESAKEKVEELSEFLEIRNKDLEDRDDEIARQRGILAEKEKLIHKYQTHDMLESEVKSIRSISAECFAEVTQEVTISEETPLSIGSSDLQIGKSKFTSYHEDTVVKYYPMIFKDKFQINEDWDNSSINITYSAESFMSDIPYRIITRKIYENMTAKLLNSYSNDALDLAIDTEGRKLLSTAEDEFIASLKRQYSVESNNSISIFVNGIPLSEWGPENKVIK
jgi:hypothetical protein